MILYDDRYLAALCGEPCGGRMHRDLLRIAILEQWSGDGDRAHEPVAAMLNELDTLLDRDAVRVFFDQYARHVGHAVAVRLSAADAAAAARDPRLARDPRRWRGGAPNWLLHVEARGGGALAMARRMRAGLDTPRRRLSYVRPGRGVATVAGRRGPARGGAIDPVYADYDARAWIASGIAERADRYAIVSLLARRRNAPYGLNDAMALAHWACALGQFRLVADATLLLWAWCDEATFGTLARTSARVPPDAAWNCGPIPVLLCAIGADPDVRAAIGDWRAQLPARAAPPRWSGFGVAPGGWGQDG